MADAAANAAIGSLPTNKRNHIPVPYEVKIIHCKGVIKMIGKETWITTKSKPNYVKVSERFSTNKTLLTSLEPPSLLITLLSMLRTAELMKTIERR